MNKTQFNQGLLDFLKASPSPFHAVASMRAQLDAAGFRHLRLEESWDLEAGQRYYCTRNDSSLVAFVFGSKPVTETGLRMVGAHTDSPCLKLKPAPALRRQGYLQLGVEVYGSVLLNPWFDRDLSLAGRVSFLTAEGELRSRLINFQRAIGIIPSLAIHLDRDANNNRSINGQRDLPPLVSMSGEGEQQDVRDILLGQLREQYPQESVERLLDWELSFYDVQAPALVGLNNEFIASARLDNLASCYIGLQAMLAADGQHSPMLICNDHEEVGSQSAAGAQGPLVKDVLARILPREDERLRSLARSWLISADNAHGIHPNFPDRHDDNHAPRLNHGPVIKTNANQRYATNSESSAVFQHICAEAQVPVQHFVSRNDMPCGSTIGPLTATALGVTTIDVGVPTFGMHSIRELAGTNDAFHFYRALQVFNGRDSIAIEGC